MACIIIEGGAETRPRDITSHTRSLDFGYYYGGVLPSQPHAG